MEDEPGEERLMIEAVDQVLERYEGMFAFRYAGDTLAERTQRVIDVYESAASKSLSCVKQFQEELLIELRAFSMVAESIGDAGTHAEKAARLRGLVGIIETAYRRVSDFNFDLRSHGWNWAVLFRSDYPSRRYAQKIADLEREIERLKGAAGKTS